MSAFLVRLLDAVRQLFPEVFGETLGHLPCFVLDHRIAQCAELAQKAKIDVEGKPGLVSGQSLQLDDADDTLSRLPPASLP